MKEHLDRLNAILAKEAEQAPEAAEDMVEIKNKEELDAFLSAELDALEKAEGEERLARIAYLQYVAEEVEKAFQEATSAEGSTKVDPTARMRPFKDPAQWTHTLAPFATDTKSDGGSNYSTGPAIEGPAPNNRPNSGQKMPPLPEAPGSGFGVSAFAKAVEGLNEKLESVAKAIETPAEQVANMEAEIKEEQEGVKPEEQQDHLRKVEDVDWSDDMNSKYGLGESDDDSPEWGWDSDIK